MVGAGLRYEARSARIRHYSHANGTAEVSPTERDGLIAFHNLLQNPSNDVLYRDKTFRNDYLGTLDKEKAGSLKLPLGDGEEISVLPTIAASESLNNSLHRDVNDASRCFAVFYQKERVGKVISCFPRLFAGDRVLAIPCACFMGWQMPTALYHHMPRWNPKSVWCIQPKREEDTRDLPPIFLPTKETEEKPGDGYGSKC